MSSPRIGVGIVGLSAERGWAAKAHVAALAMLDDFELRGLVGSSAESARAAAARHGVAHAGDRLECLLDRRDIELVVVSVKVPEHRHLVEACLRAGKAVLCEWPLARNLAEAEALAAVALETGRPCFVDLQARGSPAVRFIGDLLRQGYVGRTLSTSVLAAAGAPWGGECVQRSEVIYQSRENGATMLSIPVGHMLDTLCCLLGGFERPRATLACQRSEVPLVDSEETIPVTSPDQVCISGCFGQDVVGSLHYRAAVKRGTSFHWEINGTAGDILVQASHAHPQFGNLRIQGAAAGARALEPLEVPQHYWTLARTQASDRSSVAYNVALVYRQIVLDLRTGSAQAPGLADAVELHRRLDAIERAAAAR
jgi:predicted dehydrogenase